MTHCLSFFWPRLGDVAKTSSSTVVCGRRDSLDIFPSFRQGAVFAVWVRLSRRDTIEAEAAETENVAQMAGPHNDPA